MSALEQGIKSIIARVHIYKNSVSKNSEHVTKEERGRQVAGRHFALQINVDSGYVSADAIGLNLL